MKFLRMFGDFLQKFYDKIILLFLLAGLTASLVYQINNLQKTKDAVDKADQNLAARLPKNSLEDLQDDIFRLSTDVDEDRLWAEAFGEGSLMEPGNYVYSIDGKPYLLHITTIRSPFTEKWDLPEGDRPKNVGSSSKAASKDDDITRDSDADGIPDVVEEKLGLNRKDPDDSGNDLDGDGFSNLEEYEAETALDDDDEHPKLATRLRFRKRPRETLPILLKKVNRNNNPDDKRSWDIFIKYRPKKKWKSEFLKIGDSIPKFGYKITDADYTEITRKGIPVEQSQITLVKGEAQPIVLEKDKEAYAAGATYELILLFQKAKRFPIDVDQEFTLSDLKGNEEHYELVSASEKRLKAKYKKSGKKFSISAFTKEDHEKWFSK